MEHAQTVNECVEGSLPSCDIHKEAPLDAEGSDDDKSIADEAWQISRILKRRTGANNQAECLVQWCGCGPEGTPWQPSWIPEEQLDDCRDAMDHFETNCPESEERQAQAPSRGSVHSVLNVRRTANALQYLVEFSNEKKQHLWQWFDQDVVHRVAPQELLVFLESHLQVEFVDNG